MSGIVYSELANWDGGFSLSGSQAAVSDSGSPVPASALTSATEIAFAGDEVFGASELGAATAVASGPSSATTTQPPNPHSMPRATQNMPAQDARSSRIFTTQAERLDAAKPHHVRAPTRQSTIFTPEREAASCPRVSLGEQLDSSTRQVSALRYTHSAAAGHAQPMSHHISSPSTSSHAPRYSSTAKHTTATFSAARIQSSAPRSAQESSSPVNQHVTLHSLVLAYGGSPKPRETPATPSLAHTIHNPAIEDDVSSLLDADGETDHEGVAEVYPVHASKGTRFSGSTVGNDATQSEARASTESTAIPHSNAPGWERPTNPSLEGSYSLQFLQASQQYYVSRSPSIRIIEYDPNAVKAPSTSALPQNVIGHKQVSSTHTGLSPFERRNDSVISLSPLTTPSPSPVSVQTTPAKRRRLNFPYVEVPSLPRSRRKSTYRLARDIPILQEGAPEDYAVQLGRALNQASASNAALMNYSPPPSASRVERPVRRKTATASMSTTKSAPPQTPAGSLAIRSKKRGRLLGSQIKPKPKVVQSEPQEVEEIEEHCPADVMEPHFPSVGVDIGELPPPSEALLLVAFQAAFNLQRDRNRCPAFHPISPKEAVTSTSEDVPRPPIPRRTLFKQTPSAASLQQSITSASSHTSPPASPPYTQPHSRTRSPSIIASQLKSKSPEQHELVHSSESAPPTPVPLPPTSVLSSDRSGEINGLDMLADYGSFPPPHAFSASNRPSDDVPNAPSSPVRSAISPSLSPETKHRTSQAGIMHFHLASQYAGSSGVADMFAADKALRDVHNGYGGMLPPDGTGLGESYFTTMDLDVHYEDGATGYPWLPETDPHAAHANGTIDPSLLGGVLGPPPQPQPLSPSPPPRAPVAGPSSTSSGVQRASPATSSQSRSVSEPGTPKLTRTGSTSSAQFDSDAGRTRSLKRKRVQPQLPIRLPCEEEREEGKRPRRMTQRALASYYESDSMLDIEPVQRPGKAKGKGKGKGKGAGKGKGKERAKATSAPLDEELSFKALAEAPTFCHQCRRKTARDKMRCTVIKVSGDRCGLRFCDYCVEKRYPDLTFNPYAVRFSCPRCQGTCNCTSCCARRGEPYISTRVGKLPPAGSAEALALTAAAAEASASKPAASKVPSAKPNLGLVGGEYFGVIYGLTGERVGAGFVGSDNRGIVLGDRRIPKVVAYIGKRRKGAAPSVLSASKGVGDIPPSSLADVPPGGATGAQTNTTELTHPLGVSAGVFTGSLPASVPSPSVDPFDTSLQSPSLAPVDSDPPAPPRRMYVGNRAALDKGIYVPMDVLLATMAEEQEGQAQDRSQEWAAPSSDSAWMQGDGPSSDEQHAQGANALPPSHDEVQWAIALALHALEVDAVQS